MHSLGRWGRTRRPSSPRVRVPQDLPEGPIYVLVYATVIGLCRYTRSILPLLYVGPVNLYGAWL
jgi:hypothetical protein